MLLQIKAGQDLCGSAISVSSLRNSETLDAGAGVASEDSHFQTCSSMLTKSSAYGILSCVACEAMADSDMIVVIAWLVPSQQRRCRVYSSLCRAHHEPSSDV